jgi:hypothetical protein
VFQGESPPQEKGQRMLCYHLEPLVERSQSARPQAGAAALLEDVSVKGLVLTCKLIFKNQMKRTGITFLAVNSS